MSNISDILENNKNIRKEHERLQGLIEQNLAKLKAPCMECLYDGVFRCEACAEHFYEGYNTRNYPR